MMGSMRSSELELTTDLVWKDVRGYNVERFSDPLHPQASQCFEI